MKALINTLKTNTVEILANMLNLGGTGLVIIGVCLLPIIISIKLIILGLLSLTLWKTIA